MTSINYAIPENPLHSVYKHCGPSRPTGGGSELIEYLKLVGWMVGFVVRVRVRVHGLGRVSVPVPGSP